jgi:hypothetical protein
MKLCSAGGQSAAAGYADAHKHNRGEASSSSCKDIGEDVPQMCAETASHVRTCKPLFSEAHLFQLANGPA